MKLTLIRHGVTEGNMKKLYYGSTDIPLLPCSEMKLHRMAEGGGYPTAPHYYTSGMIRTEQTFRALYGDIPHEGNDSRGLGEKDHLASPRGNQLPRRDQVKRSGRCDNARNVCTQRRGRLRVSQARRQRP